MKKLFHVFIAIKQHNKLSFRGNQINNGGIGDERRKKFLVRTEILDFSKIITLD